MSDCEADNDLKLIAETEGFKKWLAEQDIPDTSIINCRPGEAESRALLKISRLLGDLLPAERERVLADINAKYARQDDHR